MTVIITTNKESYEKEDVNSVTVGELINFLHKFNPSEKIILSFDNGYTYGGIFGEDIEFEDESEENSYKDKDFDNEIAETLRIASVQLDEKLNFSSMIKEAEKLINE